LRERQLKTNEEIFEHLSKLIHELFEVPMEDIKFESRFYEDLGLDSIDAIDLIGQVQVMVGTRLDPEHFKEVLTVGDVVKSAQLILADQENVNA
jgi:acyl carrier protein